MKSKNKILLFFISGLFIITIYGFMKKPTIDNKKISDRVLLQQAEKDKASSLTYAKMHRVNDLQF